MGSQEALVGAIEMQKPEAGGSARDSPCVGHSSGLWALEVDESWAEVADTRQVSFSWVLTAPSL